MKKNLKLSEKYTTSTPLSLDTPLDDIGVDLKISIRAQRSFWEIRHYKRNKQPLKTLGDLINTPLSKFARQRNIGQVTLKEIKEIAKTCGYLMKKGKKEKKSKLLK